MGKKNKKYQIITCDGPPCFRCGGKTQVRMHKSVTSKQLRQPFYYKEWYYCLNSKCKTTLIMQERHKIFNKNYTPFLSPPNDLSAETKDRLLAIQQQFPSSGEKPPWED